MSEITSARSGVRTPAEQLLRLWERGGRPDLDAFLATQRPLNVAELAAVLRVDQRQRWKSGAEVRAEDYLDRYPEVRHDAEHAVDLVFNEFLLRERRGEQPNIREYECRFPEFAQVLAEQMKVHEAVGGDSPGHLTASLPATYTSGGPASAPAEAPDEIGRYSIIKVIGRGGMGVVYQAWHTGLNRVAALKMALGGAHAAPEDIARFRTEAEAVARLQHPNIVQIHEVGTDRGHWFLALEYVDGGSLAAQLGGTPLPARRAAELAETLARAVDYAHQRGIVHRDLTPANVLLTRDGVPKITDFGLAKMLVGGAGKTQTGAILGTPSYMSPEQASGGAKDVGPATDVYSLGAILYEMLTGRPPFKAESPLDTVLQVANQEPAPPSVLQPNLPRDLETICLKRLRKEPTRRYASGAELADDLLRFQKGEPVTARSVGRLERVWRWARRNPVVAGLLAAVALLLLVVAVGSSVTALWLGTALADAQTNLQRALEAEVDADTNRWRGLVLDARAWRLSRGPGQRFAALKKLREAVELAKSLNLPSASFDEMRNEAIAALALPDLYLEEGWSGFPPGSVNANMNRPFDLYIRTNEKGAVSVRRLAADEEVAQLPELGEQVIVTLDAQGVLARYAPVAQRFQVWDVSQPTPALRLDLQGGGRPPLENWHCRADGRQIALLEQGGGIEVYNVADGGLAHRVATNLGLNFSKFGEMDVLLHPSAPFALVSSYHQPKFEILDLRTGKQSALIDPHWTHGMGHCAWSPDGARLAVPAGDGGQIVLYGFDPGKGTVEVERFIASPPNASGGFYVSFNPAGDRLVAHDWSAMVFLVDIQTGRTLFSTRPIARVNRDWLRFDPAGARLGLFRNHEASNSLGFLSVGAGQEYRALVPRRSRTTPPGHPQVVFPDSRLAAMSFPEGVDFFDLERGEEVAFLPMPMGKNHHGLGLAIDRKNGFYTNTFEGFLRWPIRPDVGAPGQWSIGPPEKLPFHLGNGDVAVSDDGTVVAQPMWSGYGMQEFAGGWIKHPGAPAPRVVERGIGQMYPAVSPDGKWVAFTGKVYDAATGHCVLQTQGIITTFSIDSKWLLSNSDGGRIYATGSWTPGLQLGAGYPWDVSPDGRIAVLGVTNGTYRLVELATGRELARLDDPDQTNGAAVFSPDGTRLVAGATDGLRVWDLRLIRTRLQELGLDWDAPPYPEKPATPGPPARAFVIDEEAGKALKMLQDTLKGLKLDKRREPQ